MEIRQEFEQALRKEWGIVSDSDIEFALWAAKWAMEKCKKSICKYCDLERPLIGNIHTWQVLTSKDKKGKFIYNPVQEECLATPIRKLAKELDE